MVVNLNSIFYNIYFYFILFSILTSIIILNLNINIISFTKNSSNHTEKETDSDSNGSDTTDNSKKEELKDSKDSEKSNFKNINGKEAYLKYIKDYLNKNKNFYNVKFNLDYNILKQRYYKSTYLTKVLKYLVDSTTRRHYAVKLKLKPIKYAVTSQEIKETLKNYKGNKNYLLFLKLLNQQDSILYYKNFKTNNYVNDLFFYNLTKKLNFKFTYKFLNNSLFNNLLEHNMNDFNASHMLSQFKVEFKFLKSLMNHIFRGNDPLRGSLYKFFSYRYYENHLLFTMKRIYNRTPSTRYFLMYYLEFFSDIKYEITNLYKLVHTALFANLMKTEQLQFPYLPIEGTKLFTSELKRFIGSGKLQRVFFDFLGSSNFLPLSDRNDYEYPYYSFFYSYYNRLAKYFTNKRTILEGSFLIETQIYLFLTKYFPSMENIFLLKNSIPFISYKDYLFGITRYSFPNFYDFKFYLPFPVEEIENIFGINEHRLRKPSIYSIYYKTTINLFDFIRPYSLNLKPKKFLLSNDQFLNFRLHRNYFFRQLFGSFTTALRKLEDNQLNTNVYSLMANNIFQFLYGKSSQDIFNINSDTSKTKPSYEGSIAFASVKNISIFMSYKKAGFLNKLTRLSKRYEDYLQRQVVSKYLKFFFKLKPNFKKIYFNLNSQRMKFKINLYDFIKEIYFKRYKVYDVLFSLKQNIIIHTVLNNYFQFYYKNSSMFKFKFNYYYTQLASNFDYVLIQFIQFYLNKSINYINVLLFNQLFINYDFKINLYQNLVDINKLIFIKLYKIYQISIISSLDNVLNTRRPSLLFIHLVVYLSHVSFSWFFSSLNYLISLFYLTIEWKLHSFIQYLILITNSLFTIIKNFFYLIFFILQFQLHKFDFIFIYIYKFYLFFIKSNVIIQLILKLFQLDSLILFKTGMDYLFWYWPLYLDYMLDLIVDRIVYLWYYQHFYLFLPSFMFWNYFFFFGQQWTYLTIDPLTPILVYVITQFCIIFTHTKLYQFFSSEIFLKLFNLIQTIFTNPNFILKFIIGYILILIHYIYHSYYILSPFFPMIYLICVLFFCIIYFIIYSKINIYKMRLSRHHFVPKFHFSIFSVHYLKVFYHFLDNFLGGFLTYARLALIFLLAVENAKEENSYRASKFKELKEKNISYRLNLTKIKKHL